MHVVIKWVLAHWSFSAFVILMFVQITPAIKWNPLQWLGGLFMGGLKKSIEEIRCAIDENEKDRIRWEVLDFANSCRNGVRHTRDQFQHIIALNDKYRALLARSDDTNGVFDEDYAYIVKLYRERLEKNDFL